MRIKSIARIAVIALACYGALHLIGVATEARAAWPLATARPAAGPTAAALTARQQPLVSALTRLLSEDGVQQAERWATAIVRASPTDDLGYLALVTAQIRRESHFLAPDLEWVYQRVVPDLVHSLGVEDPIRTIGPMQVQRWRLHDHFEQALGERLDAHAVRELALDIETGVAACVAVLDRIVVEHAPDRRLRGWIHERGPRGLHPHAQVLASAVLAPTSESRSEALRQKLLSDLTSEPLALDGVRGPNTSALLARHPQWADDDTLRRDWQDRFATPAPGDIAPRIAHDPRVAFVLADFHSGMGASRTAALQALVNLLFATDLACDGKWGPLTRAAMPRLLAAAEPDEGRRADFLALLASGDKQRWLRQQLLAMARRVYRERTGTAAPAALVPDLWFDGPAQRIKGLGRISVAGYVAGSTAFFEDHLRRLSVYTGSTPDADRSAR